MTLLTYRRAFAAELMSTMTVMDKSTKSFCYVKYPTENRTPARRCVAFSRLARKMGVWKPWKPWKPVGKQSIPTTGLSPASPTALWAAEQRLTPRSRHASRNHAGRGRHHLRDGQRRCGQLRIRRVIGFPGECRGNRGGTRLASARSRLYDGSRRTPWPVGGITEKTSGSAIRSNWPRRGSVGPVCHPLALLWNRDRC
jgi:hypothetical protein